MPLFSDHAHEILPSIWLGNYVAATDTVWLKQQGITCIFNCTKDIPFHTAAYWVTQRYRLPVDDNLAASEIDNMCAWAAEAVAKVYQEWRAGHRILIHCYAGRQRSAALVAMLLILLLGKTADMAMEYIRKKRPVAFFPAANFERAIRQFELDYNNAIRRRRVSV
jgi:protein tyrosine/serine phosphatase